MNTKREEGLLSPYRVLDLTTEIGLRCAKLLAELGADVIKIEKPGGDPARNIGPFYYDVPHPEKSLYWFAFNLNKKSITLNLEMAQGREIFKRLVRKADFVVESFGPGYLEKLGLGYETLNKINPRLILTSISPFGEKGPYNHWKGSDIVALALGGLMYQTGEFGRPPVRIWGSYTYTQVGAQAALGTLLAHYYRELTGEGQRVEISMQEAVTLALASTQQAWYLNRENYVRRGHLWGRAGRTLRRFYPCQDGYVHGLPLEPRMLPRVIEWMVSEGKAQDLQDPRWENRGTAPGPRQLTQEEIEHIEGVVTDFFRDQTKAQICAAAQAQRIAFCPVNSVAEVAADTQLAARNFFTPVEHEELNDALIYPGRPYKLHGAKLRPLKRAPRIGEHNQEIYTGELGLSPEEIALLRGAGVI